MDQDQRRIMSNQIHFNALKSFGILLFAGAVITVLCALNGYFPELQSSLKWAAVASSSVGVMASLAFFFYALKANTMSLFYPELIDQKTWVNRFWDWFLCK